MKPGIYCLRAALAATMAAAVTAAAASGATPATTRSDSALEEITVTATRRDEKQLDVPASIQVFTDDAIVKANITRPQDFLALTPNVTFIQDNHAGEAFVNIRGQTSIRQSESAVAVVIDGVQLATQNEFNGQLFDIQQIEILKGPQSALYGRNATAGAIVITTKAPTDELSAEATADVGNWHTAKESLSVGGAIIPGVLRIRAAVANSDTDGPYQNIETGEFPNRSAEKTGRLRLDWLASDNLTLDLRLGASYLDGGAIAATAQGPGIVNGGIPAPLGTNLNGSPYVSDVPGLDIQNKLNASLKVDYQLGFATFTSVTAASRIIDQYQAHLFPYQSAYDPQNDAGNAILFGDQTQKYRIENEALSQEFRLSSVGKTRLRWQGGLYYLRSRKDFVTIQGFNGRVPLNPDGTPNAGISGYEPDPNGIIYADLSPALASVFGTHFTRLLQGGGEILPNFGINGLNTVNPTNAYDDSNYGVNNVAPFGNLQFDILDSLELDAALRYDHEHRTVETRTPNAINPFTGVTFNQCVALLGLAPDQCRQSESFSALQPKVSLRYKVEESTSVYASYGRGFKSGGYNALGSRQIVVNATAVGSTLAAAEKLVTLEDSYPKEISDSEELGFKSQFAGGIASVEGAVFYTKVKNAQQFSFYPSGSVQAVSSIDQVNIKGAELSLNGRVTHDILLFAAYGYNDAKIAAFAAQPLSVGNTAPYAAKYNYTAGFQVDRPVTSDLTANLRFEYNGTGKIWFDTVNTPGTQRDPIQLANLRAGVSTDRWEAALWSRNLFNREYNEESVVLPTGIGTFNPLFKGLTRSFGVEGRVKF